MSTMLIFSTSEGPALQSIFPPCFVILMLPFCTIRCISIHFDLLKTFFIICAHLIAIKIIYILKTIYYCKEKENQRGFGFLFSHIGYSPVDL